MDLVKKKLKKCFLKKNVKTFYSFYAKNVKISDLKKLLKLF